MARLRPVPRSIVVVRALQLGDLLCAVPAFRALRAAFPEARIILVGLPWARSFVERYECYLDGLLEFPGYLGLPERELEPRRFPAFLSVAHAEKFDLAIQMHGSGGFVNSLTVLLGAHRQAGLYIPGQYCPDPEYFLPYPDDEPEVRRHLHLMEFLGVAPRGEQLEFPATANDHCAFAAICNHFHLQPGYVCIHPGVRAAGRRWDPV